VCDVGGGSTQIVVGSRDGGPAWARSLDLGSLRVTRRASFADPPTVERIEAALALVRLRFISLTPPLPQAAHATGGSARASRVWSATISGLRSLRSPLRILAERPARRLAKAFDLSAPRARTLAAGAVLLASAQALLGVPLVVARGGLREGLALALLAESAAAA